MIVGAARVLEQQDLLDSRAFELMHVNEQNRQRDNTEILVWSW